MPDFIPDLATITEAEIDNLRGQQLDVLIKRAGIRPIPQLLAGKKECLKVYAQERDEAQGHGGASSSHGIGRQGSAAGANIQQMHLPPRIPNRKLDVDVIYSAVGSSWSDLQWPGVFVTAEGVDVKFDPTTDGYSVNLSQIIPAVISDVEDQQDPDAYSDGGVHVRCGIFRNRLKKAGTVGSLTAQRRGEDVYKQVALDDGRYHLYVAFMRIVRNSDPGQKVVPGTTSADSLRHYETASRHACNMFRLLPPEILTAIWKFLPPEQLPWNRQSAQVRREPIVVAHQWLGRWREAPRDSLVVPAFLRCRLNLDHPRIHAALQILAEGCEDNTFLRCQREERDALVEQMLAAHECFGECLTFDAGTKIGRRLLEAALPKTKNKDGKMGISVFEPAEYLHGNCGSYFEWVCEKGWNVAALACCQISPLPVADLEDALISAFLLGDPVVFEHVRGGAVTPLCPARSATIIDLVLDMPDCPIGSLDMFIYLTENSIMPVWDFHFHQWRDLPHIIHYLKLLHIAIPPATVRDFLKHALVLEHDQTKVKFELIQEFVNSFNVNIDRHSTGLQSAMEGRYSDETRETHCRKLRDLLWLGMSPANLTQRNLTRLMCQIAGDAVQSAGEKTVVAGGEPKNADTTTDVNEQRLWWDVLNCVNAAEQRKAERAGMMGSF
ncbi:uncharacterized protein EV422DRAFT_112194 [Fimicolochytrium jonesii]|uniref:uncharacterized protein n=1 Tax=Fimicolochytrium jonesii TaxID=1396493 RepID=UPI0022FDC382|nr:uncharacterized protein EV422DRAFT_112194 [Fimicolochytrium jonesii]KAI8819419.1 hypothetical protein EV422DRAFT_112194 [Fimicolochytrium jonesii]